MFYLFRQNNSGGSYSNPARNVYVEAGSEEEAKDIFLSIDGCYFDPNFEQDCECCGTRWTDDIWGTFNNSYEVMRELEETYLTSINWSVRKEDIPFALIKGKDKDTLIP